MNTRNKRKHITVVKGLEGFEVDLAAAAKARIIPRPLPAPNPRIRTAPPNSHAFPHHALETTAAEGGEAEESASDTTAERAVPSRRRPQAFGKKFACGSALQRGKGGQQDQIEIQGDAADALPAFIASKHKIALSDIFVVVDGKKVPASELGA